MNEVHERVALRASRMLPDATVHVTDLVFTPGGYVEVPDIGLHDTTPLAADRSRACMFGRSYARGRSLR